MAPIGIGIIGCGDIARARYFPSVDALPDFVLVAACSRTMATAEAAAARYGGRAYADVDACLADPRVEAVIIATPHPSHAELTVKALEAGKHVLTEKPIATSPADAARIRSAAERTDRVFMPLPFDALPPVVEARRLMRSGAIGRVTSADAVLAHLGPVHAPWFLDRDKAEWGVMADLGIYLVGALTYLFGAAESVFGRVETVLPTRTSDDGRTVASTVDDNAVAAIVWPKGVLGSMRASWCITGDRRNFVWETRLYGTEGILFLNMASPTDTLVVHSPKRPVEGAGPIVHNGLTDCYLPALPAWDHHLDIVRRFADAITGRDSPEPATLARHEHVIELIAGVYESSRTGRIQAVATQF